jgi:hypothetical protein
MRNLLRVALQLIVGVAAVLGFLYSDSIYALFVYPMIASVLILLIAEEV